MPLDIQPLPSDSINTKWKEPFASASLNRRPVGITPPGIYRGLVLGEDPLAGDRTIVVIEDPDKGDHVAVYENPDGFSVNYRDGDSGTITLSLASYTSTVVVVTLFVEYAIGVETTGFFRTYTQSEYNAIPQATRDALVVLGTVTVPASGPIAESSIALTGRTLASSNLQRGLVQNPPIVRNPNFEIGDEGQTHLHSSQYWEKTVTAGSGSWNTTTTLADSGTKSIQMTVSSGPVTGALKQYAGIESTPGEIITANVSVWQINTVSSGDFEFFVEFTDSDGLVLTTLTTDLDGGAVDSDWRVVTPIIATPVGAVSIRSFGIRANVLSPTSNGLFAYIDTVEVFIEPSNPQFPYAFDQRYRQRLNTTGIQLMEKEADFAQLMADISFDDTSPSGEGSVILDALNASNDPPALALAGRLLDLGSQLLASGTNARKPRISAEQADGGVSLYTLMWQSRRGGGQGSRFYVKDDGSLHLVVNATWDGANWNDDDGAFGASRCYLDGGNFIVQTVPAGSGTWADGSWTDTQMTASYVAAQPTVTLENSELQANEDVFAEKDVYAKRQIILGENLRSVTADAETPRLYMNSATSGVNTRTLFAELTGPDDAPRLRIYSSAIDQTTLELTNNARWDESLGQWVRDDASQNMSVFRLQDRDLWYLSSSLAGPIDDSISASGWNGCDFNFDTIVGELRLGMNRVYDSDIVMSDGRIRFNNNGGNTNPSRTSTGRTSEAIALNQCKSWGYLSAGGFSSAGINDGFNLASVTNNGGLIQINFATSLGTSNYAVVQGTFGENPGGSNQGGAYNLTSSSFRSSWVYNTGELDTWSYFYAVFART